MKAAPVAWIILASLAALGLAWLYSHWLVEEIIEVEIVMRVDDHFGLNADADKLNFGRLMPYTSSERSFSIKNTKEYPLQVGIVSLGATAPWVRLSESSFTLLPEHNRTITAVLSAETEEFGVYSGKLRVVLQRPLFG